MQVYKGSSTQTRRKQTPPSLWRKDSSALPPESFPFLSHLPTSVSSCCFYSFKYAAAVRLESHASMQFYGRTRKFKYRSRLSQTSLGMRFLLKLTDFRKKKMHHLSWVEINLCVQDKRSSEIIEGKANVFDPTATPPSPAGCKLNEVVKKHNFTTNRQPVTSDPAREIMHFLYLLQCSYHKMPDDFRVCFKVPCLSQLQSCV